MAKRTPEGTRQRRTPRIVEASSTEASISAPASVVVDAASPASLMSAGVLRRALPLVSPWVRQWAMLADSPGALGGMVQRLRRAASTMLVTQSLRHLHQIEQLEDASATVAARYRTSLALNARFQPQPEDTPNQADLFSPESAPRPMPPPILSDIGEDQPGTERPSAEVESASWDEPAAYPFAEPLNRFDVPRMRLGRGALRQRAEGIESTPLAGQTRPQPPRRMESYAAPLRERAGRAPAQPQREDDATTFLSSEAAPPAPLKSTGNPDSLPQMPPVVTPNTELIAPESAQDRPVEGNELETVAPAPPTWDITKSKVAAIEERIRRAKEQLETGHTPEEVLPPAASGFQELDRRVDDAFRQATGSPTPPRRLPPSIGADGQTRPPQLNRWRAFSRVEVISTPAPVGESQSEAQTIRGQVTRVESVPAPSPTTPSAEEIPPTPESSQSTEAAEASPLSAYHEEADRPLTLTDPQADQATLSQLSPSGSPDALSAPFAAGENVAMSAGTSADEPLQPVPSPAETPTLVASRQGHSSLIPPQSPSQFSRATEPIAAVASVRRDSVASTRSAPVLSDEQAPVQERFAGQTGQSQALSIPSAQPRLAQAPASSAAGALPPPDIASSAPATAPIEPEEVSSADLVAPETARPTLTPGSGQSLAPEQAPMRRATESLMPGATPAEASIPPAAAPESRRPAQTIRPSRRTRTKAPIVATRSGAAVDQRQTSVAPATPIVGSDPQTDPLPVASRSETASALVIRAPTQEDALVTLVESPAQPAFSDPIQTPQPTPLPVEAAAEITSLLSLHDEQISGQEESSLSLPPPKGGQAAERTVSMQPAQPSAPAQPRAVLAPVAAEPIPVSAPTGATSSAVMSADLQPEKSGTLSGMAAVISAPASAPTLVEPQPEIVPSSPTPGQEELLSAQPTGETQGPVVAPTESLADDKANLSRGAQQIAVVEPMTASPVSIRPDTLPVTELISSPRIVRTTEEATSPAAVAETLNRISPHAPATTPENPAPEPQSMVADALMADRVRGGASAASVMPERPPRETSPSSQPAQPAPPQSVTTPPVTHDRPTTQQAIAVSPSAPGAPPTQQDAPPRAEAPPARPAGATPAPVTPATPGAPPTRQDMSLGAEAPPARPAGAMPAPVTATTPGAQSTRQDAPPRAEAPPARPAGATPAPVTPTTPGAQSTRQDAPPRAEAPSTQPAGATPAIVTPTTPGAPPTRQVTSLGAEAPPARPAAATPAPVTPTTPGAPPTQQDAPPRAKAPPARPAGATPAPVTPTTPGAPPTRQDTSPRAEAPPTRSAAAPAPVTPTTPGAPPTQQVTSLGAEAPPTRPAVAPAPGAPPTQQDAPLQAEALSTRVTGAPAPVTPATHGAQSTQQDAPPRAEAPPTRSAGAPALTAPDAPPTMQDASPRAEAPPTRSAGAPALTAPDAPPTLQDASPRAEAPPTQTAGATPAPVTPATPGAQSTQQDAPPRAEAPPTRPAVAPATPDAQSTQQDAPLRTEAPPTRLAVASAPVTPGAPLVQQDTSLGAEAPPTQPIVASAPTAASPQQQIATSATIPSMPSGRQDEFFLPETSSQQPDVTSPVVTSASADRRAPMTADDGASSRVTPSETEVKQRVVGASAANEPTLQPPRAAGALLHRFDEQARTQSTPEQTRGEAFPQSGAPSHVSALGSPDTQLVGAVQPEPQLAPASDAQADAVRSASAPASAVTPVDFSQSKPPGSPMLTTPDTALPGQATEMTDNLATDSGQAPSEFTAPPNEVRQTGTDVTSGPSRWGAAGSDSPRPLTAPPLRTPNAGDFPGAPAPLASLPPGPGIQRRSRARGPVQLPLVQPVRPLIHQPPPGAFGASATSAQGRAAQPRGSGNALHAAPVAPPPITVTSAFSGVTSIIQRTPLDRDEDQREDGGLAVERAGADATTDLHSGAKIRPGRRTGGEPGQNILPDAGVSPFERQRQTNGGKGSSSYTSALPLAAPMIQRAPAESHAAPAPQISRLPATSFVQRAQTGSEAIATQVEMVTGTDENAGEEANSVNKEQVLNDLARQIYPLVKRLIALERERRPFG